MSLYGGGVGGVGGRVTGRGYAPACAGLEAQDSYELRVTTVFWLIPAHKNDCEDIRPLAW